MTPAARVAAAIEILDNVLGGQPAERVLTNWARGNRYAGSGDRAAIRDHVFASLRCKRSYAARGGANTGRGLMIGQLRAAGVDPATVFTGARFAPAPLSGEELRPPPGAMPENVALDVPDWLAAELHRSLGAEFAATMQALQARAPVFLRANLRRATVAEVQQSLLAAGIETRPHPLSPSALEVIAGARRVQQSDAYKEGLVELQDAASQAASDCVPVPPGASVLDFCAGGGGKTLALAARAQGRFFAFDADSGRMKDLPGRAARAGVRVKCLDIAQVAEAAPFDVILADVPCSGSGAWRRAPEGKWRLDQPGLARFLAVQAGILRDCAARVAQRGCLVYMTCSLLRCENEDQVQAFLQTAPDWQVDAQRRISLREGGDGFFVAVLRGL